MALENPVVFERYETARRCCWRPIDADVDTGASKTDLITSDPTIILILFSPGPTGSALVRIRLSVEVQYLCPFGNLDPKLLRDIHALPSPQTASKYFSPFPAKRGRKWDYV